MEIKKFLLPLEGDEKSFDLREYAKMLSLMTSKGILNSLCVEAVGNKNTEKWEAFKIYERKIDFKTLQTTLLLKFISN